jgi:hypothetical protein
MCECGHRLNDHFIYLLRRDSIVASHCYECRCACYAPAPAAEAPA